MIKLAVISHALVQEIPRKRWRLLAEKHPVEVTLLVPGIWRSSWFTNNMEYRARPENRGGFRILPMPTTSRTNWSRFLFLSPDTRLARLKPDIIYVIQEESNWVHQQVIAYRNLWSPRSRMIFFSMNALGTQQRKWHQRLRWDRIKNHYDAALCHYPGCLESLRRGGFTKPVYMQTQVGVDEELYRPDGSQRLAVRERLGLSNRFVIGFAGRLSRDKGIQDLLDAMPLEETDWSLLIVGNGEYRDEIERFRNEPGWANRIHLVGAVPHEEVPDYMRAMDCLVLPSRTRSYWIDTFPNVLAQAMACRVPVIGSDSGAIPYLTGDSGLIFPEGDTAGLREHLRTLAQDTSLREDLAEGGRRQSIRRFGVEMITRNFYDIMQQVLSGRFQHDLDEDDQRKAW